MNYKKVSIILPTYNRSGMINRAILSVLNQTYKDIELIIVDDFSQDWEVTYDFLQNLNDNRVKYIRHNKNMNGAVSRNTGIDKAQGGFIAFIDSDDEWDIDKLEKQVDCLMSYGSNVILSCRSRVIRRKFIEILPRSLYKGENLSEYLFVDDGYLPTPSLIMKKNVALKIKFCPNLKRHQDYDFLLRAYAQGVKIEMLEDCLVTVYANHKERSEERGAGYTISNEFLNDYQMYMTERAKINFYVKCVLFYMARNKKRFKALFDMLDLKKIKALGSKNYILYCSYVMLHSTFFYDFFEKLYYRTWGRDRNTARTTLISKK